MNTFVVNSCMIACLVFAYGFASAQQQQQQQQAGQPIAANETCTPTNTKPKPVTQTFPLQHQNKTCLVVQMAGYASIGNGLFYEIKNGQVDLNKSRCEDHTANQSTEPIIVINFDCGSLSFTIGTNNSKVYVTSIGGKFGLGNTSTTFINTTQLFTTTQPGHYYKCNAEQTVISDGNKNVSLVLSNFAYEAYRTASGTEFYQIAEECGLDSGPVSDLVLVGVGICLVVLVGIVLVAYFIGRRRWAERSSYESV